LILYVLCIPKLEVP